MKKESKEVLITSQIYEEVYLLDKNIKNLRQTMKKVKLFVKSKINQQSAEC